MKKIIVLLCVILMIITLTFSFTSCEAKKEKNILKAALELAGDNSTELQKVLEHYQTPKDSLKLEAAKFLISNMPYHSYTEIDHRFDKIFKRISIGKLQRDDKADLRYEIRRKFRIYKNHLKKQGSEPSNELVKDIESLNSDFLINNIELAFEAWYRIPKTKRASFEEFCNYILPYKSINEPIEKDSRLNLYQKYSWVYEELEKGVTLNDIVDKITSNFDFIIVDISKYYPISQSISQVEISRIGMCDDAVNYLVNVFRSLGIVSSKEYVSHMGSHHSVGHSWVYVKYGNKEYSTPIEGGKDAKEIYKEESIARVNRASFKYEEKSSFSPLATDVTSNFVKTLDLKIDNLTKIDMETPVLCVFDRAKEWEVVNSGTYSWGNSEFLNVGVNVLYLAASLSRYGKITPVNYPFYINKNKEVHYFKPEDTVIDSAILLRKYGFSVPRNRTKIDWLKGVNGGEIQVSNDKNFENAETLYIIENLNSTQLQKTNLKTSEEYKYIRFKSNNKEESYLATLAFFNNSMKKLEGDVFEENVSIGKKNGALDDNPLTFSGGIGFVIGLEFYEPKQIKAFQFQARNDGNHITVGNDYELLYWDKNWESLGIQTAKDTVLYFDVPANSLLWLRNLTEGVEEHVFTIDENKKQKWLGFDNYF